MRELLKKKNVELTTVNQLLVFLSLALVVFIYYGDTLKNEYSIDDQYAYVSNPIATNGVEDVLNIFKSNSFDYDRFKFGYRPIAILSFAVENELFGVNPKASHGINILLYTLIGFLLFRMLARLLPEGSIKLSLLTAFLFLVLPIHTEIANNVKCRDELLMLVFGLLAVILWLKEDKYYISKVLAIIFLLLSILSKKSGFIFLGVLPLASYFRKEGDWKLGLKTFLIMILPVILFRGLRKAIKSSKGHRELNFIENPLYDLHTLENKIVISLESVWFYLKNLFLPTKFVSYYGYNTIPIEGIHLTSLLAVIVIVLLLLIAIKGLKQKKVVAFGILILLGGLLPFSNLLVPAVGIVAERFISVASIGFCIFMIYGSYYLLKKTEKEKWMPYAVVLLFVYALAYLPIIKARNSEWKTQLITLEADVEKLPNNASLNVILANNYYTQLPSIQDKGRLLSNAKKALALYDKSLSIYPTKGAYNEKATILYRVYNDIDAAEKNYRKALEIDPEYLIALENIGIIYEETNRDEKSIPVFKELLKKDPERIHVYGRLAKQLSDRGENDEAIKWLDYGLKNNENDFQITLTKANVYYSMKQFDKAIGWYEKALAIQPQNNSIQNRLKELENQLKKAE